MQLHHSVWELVVSCHEVNKEVLIKDSLDEKHNLKTWLFDTV